MVANNLYFGQINSRLARGLQLSYNTAYTVRDGRTKIKQNKKQQRSTHMSRAKKVIVEISSRHAACAINQVVG